MLPRRSCPMMNGHDGLSLLPPKTRESVSWTPRWTLLYSRILIHMYTYLERIMLSSPHTISSAIVSDLVKKQ